MIGQGSGGCLNLQGRRTCARPSWKDSAGCKDSTVRPKRVGMPTSRRDPRKESAAPRMQGRANLAGGKLTTLETCHARVERKKFAKHKLYNCCLSSIFDAILLTVYLFFSFIIPLPRKDDGYHFPSIAPYSYQFLSTAPSG